MISPKEARTSSVSGERTYGLLLIVFSKLRLNASRRGSVASHCATAPSGSLRISASIKDNPASTRAFAAAARPAIA